MVTPAKDQSPYGTCFAHAAIADIESKVLIRENISYDFSEANIVQCNLNYGGAYAGGSVNIAINYLSIWGTVLEACDPYPGTIGSYPMVCRNDTCDYYKVVTEWRKIEPTRDAIKQAILDYGPVQVKAGTDWSYDYWYYNCYPMPIGCPGLCTFEDDFPPNHNMLITGWDDALCEYPEVSGGWIVKNSSGTEWGEYGYIYMGYNHGSIEGNISVITDYKDWDPNETVYYQDEHGWMDQTGYGDGLDWTLVEIDPTSAGWLHAVNFWAVTAPLTWHLRIFDNFDGNLPIDPLSDEISGTYTESGFYTIDLPILVELSAGDPVYVLMALDGHGYSSPIPLDNTGPMATDKSFISNSGGGYEAIDAGGLALGDIGVRARATTSMDRGDPAFFNFNMRDTIYAAPGEKVAGWIRPGNAGGFTSTPCNAEDSLSVYYATDLPAGYVISSSPLPLGSPLALAPASAVDLDVDIEVPCDAVPGMTFNIYLYMTFWEDGEYLEGHHDCADPNTFMGRDYYSTHILCLEIVENTEPFSVTGQADVDVGADIPQCGVRFDIINADGCDSPCSYEYQIYSEGLIGDPVFQEGIIDSVPHGQTGITFAVLDTRGATAGDTDTVTIYVSRLNDSSIVDTFSTTVHVVISTDVEEPPDLPSAFMLEQNYPNPFNPVTVIGYALPEARNVLLKVFDVSGRHIVTLVDGFQASGYRSVTWNGTDSHGIEVSSGVYFYQIVAGDWSEQKKMILLR